MNLKTRVDRLEERIPAMDKPWARLITHEGDPEAGAKLAALEAQSFNVVHRVLVSLKRQADETAH